MTFVPMTKSELGYWPSCETVILHLYCCTSINDVSIKYLIIYKIIKPENHTDFRDLCKKQKNSKAQKYNMINVDKWQKVGKYQHVF